MTALFQRSRHLVLLLALSVAGPVLAGTISGSLKKPGNKPLGEAAELMLVCGSLQSSGKSDAQGNYSLSIAASGLCTLIVGNGKSATVLLGKDPARYTFEVPDGVAPLVQR